MSTRLAELLRKYAHLQQEITPQHLQDLLRQERFTGQVTIHYRNGIPLRVEAGRPFTVPLIVGGLGTGDLTTAKT